MVMRHLLMYVTMYILDICVCTGVETYRQCVDQCLANVTASVLRHVHCFELHTMRACLNLMT